MFALPSVRCFCWEAAIVASTSHGIVAAVSKTMVLEKKADKPLKNLLVLEI